MKRAALTVAFVTTAVLALGACNALLDFGADQCKVSGDCDRLGRGLACVAGSCVPDSERANAPTVDAPGGLQSDAAGQRCESNAQCIDDNVGEPYRCDPSSGRCVAVKVDSVCPFVTPPGEIRNDNSVLIAGFLPIRGQAAPLAQPIALAYQLALQEIRKAGGLPGGPGGARRPLVAVFCDSDPSLVEAGVKHIVNSLHVPAVLALFSQTDATRFVQDYFVPNGVFTLNPQDTTEALVRLDVDRLVWHLLGTPEQVALAYRPLVTRVERYVKTSLGAAAPVRVAVVTSESPTEESISTIVRDSSNGKGIAFNGKTSADNGPDFLSLKIPSLETSPAATFNSYVDKLVAFRPHIVAFLTSFELDKFLPVLDQRLSQANAFLPVYVLGPRNARSQTTLDYLADDQVELSDKKRRRFLGVQYAGAKEKDQHIAFLSRFAEAYPQVDRATYQAVENYYDAVYWLTYGLFAAGPAAPVRGSSFAAGVRSLLAGTRIYPGSVQSISDGFATLSSRPGGQFVGALGPPDFDAASGAQRSVGAVYCYTRSGAQIATAYDVLRYLPSDGSLEAAGEFCFVGF